MIFPPNYFITIFLFLLITWNIQAQDQPIDVDSITIEQPNSLPSDTTNQAPSTKNQELRTKSQKPKTTKKALLWSLMPGGGQFYNRQAWKAPIYVGGMTGLSILAIQQSQQYKKFNQTIQDTIALGFAPTIALRQQRDQAVQRRRQAIWGIGGIYALSVLDAFAQSKIAQETRLRRPLKAAYLSAVVPGLGQIYNKSWWKLPFVYGGFGAGGGFIYYNLSRRNLYRDEFRARNWVSYRDPDPTLARLSDEVLLSRKQLFQRRFDLSIILTTAWYALTIIDAIVDGHLRDFDVDDDLSWRVEPYFTPPLGMGEVPASGGLRLGFRF